MPPVTERITGTVPAPSAANAAQDQTIAESHVTGEVTSVTFVSEANVTANGTNFRTLRLINKGQDGNGTTVIASLALDTPTTDDLADFDEKAIPLVGAAGDAARQVAVGDILAWDETVTGTGLAHSGGRVEVEITRTG